MNRVDCIKFGLLSYVFVILSSCTSFQKIQFEQFSLYPQSPKEKLPVNLNLTEEFRNYKMRYIIAPSINQIEYIPIGKALTDNVRILASELFEEVQVLNGSTIENNAVFLTPEITAVNLMPEKKFLTTWSKIDIIAKINWVFHDSHNKVLYQKETVAATKSTLGNMYTRTKVVRRGIQKNLDHLFLDSFKELTASKDFHEFASWASLHYATFANNLDRIISLTKSGLDSDIRNDIGTTPLMIAAQENFTDVSKYLLSSGANVNAQNKDGGTPLMFAAQEGHLSMVEFLLDNNAKVDLLNHFEGSALMGAASNGHMEVVELLIKKGADPNARTKYGVTPLSLAVQSGDIKTKKVLEKEIGLKYDPVQSYSPSTKEMNILGRMISITKFSPEEIRDISLEEIRSFQKEIGQPTREDWRRQGTIGTITTVFKGNKAFLSEVGSFGHKVLLRKGGEFDLNFFDSKDSTCTQTEIRLHRENDAISTYILKRYLNPGCHFLSKVEVFLHEGKTNNTKLFDTSVGDLVFVGSEPSIQEGVKMIGFSKVLFRTPEIEDQYTYNYSLGWQVKRSFFAPIPKKLLQ